ncbi:MAG: DNA cytosine methyltransferase [Thalassobaculum sp.]
MIVDLFAGGGGASLGIEMATGRYVDVAVNHDPEAVALHQRNHPFTRHFVQDVFEVDPAEVAAGREIDLLWASPDCKHFSKARGGAPASPRVRSLAWVVCRWAGTVRPRRIFMENVEEFTTWGPLRPKRTHRNRLVLDDKGRPVMVPCRRGRGRTFRAWIRHLERLGYAVEWRELIAADYGAPTTRKRLYVIARCDGEPIVWPAQTHADTRLEPSARRGMKPWRSAASIIDWSIPCPSIFLTREEGRKAGVNRPLADKTMARIARGTDRYVLRNPRPFIVPITHTGDRRTHDTREPVRTVTTANRGELALVMPHLARHYGSDGGTIGDIQGPAATVTTRGTQQQIVAPILQKFHGERHAGEARGSVPTDPVPTVDTSNRVSIVAPLLVPRYGEREGQAPRSRDVTRPMPAVVPTQNGAQLVAAFLAQHNDGPRPGQPGRSCDAPVSTITATGSQQALVTAHVDRAFGRTAGAGAADPVPTVTERGKTAVVATHVARLYGSNKTASGGSTTAPLSTHTAGGRHHAVVAAFMQKYHGTGGQHSDMADPFPTVTAADCLAPVTVTIAGDTYALVDIGMRMFTPRELYRAQGFPDSYVIDAGLAGKWLTKTAQIRMCGNSVCPPVAAAIVSANMRPAAIAAEVAA